MILNAEFDVDARSGRHHVERVASARVLTVGGGPASGGSGGGTNPSTDNTVAGSIWAQPIPQAVLGLNSSVVYGSNFQASVPSNFQLATGGLFQLVVDPVGFLTAFKQGIAPDTAMLLGAGTAGNVQVTLGSNVAITLGMAFEVQVGPEKIELHSSEKAGIRWLNVGVGIVLLILTAVYLIVYAIISTDEERAILTGIYQVACQIAVALMISYDTLYWFQYKAQNDAYTELHVANPPSDLDQSHAIDVERMLANFGAGLVGFGGFQVLLTPPIMDAIGEGQLHPLVEASNQAAAREQSEHA
jgi:hypothetical protein